MKLQKRIGIIIGRIYKEINRQLLTGILNQAYSLGFSAYTFTLIEENQDEKTMNGEDNLLNLINFSLLDAVIFVPYSFSTDEARRHAEEFLVQNCTRPIICISGEKHIFPCIWHDNRSEFAEITRHLIDVHGCRRIFCLTGPENMTVSKLRLNGFLDAMQAAGLSCGEENMIYGDYWYNTAQMLAEEIASGKRKLPDAVVCANDIMAIALCDALMEKGFSVPNDIRIIGYDGTWETVSHNPPITTYRTSWNKLGQDAMRMIYEKITGESAPALDHASGKLLTRKSCGCVQSDYDKPPADIAYQKMEDGYLDSNLSNHLLSADNLSDFAHSICNLTYVFMDHVYYEKESYCLCLCEDWDAVSPTGSAESYRRIGYSDTMLLATDITDRTVFKTADLVPPGHIKDDSPSVTFFTAVHFKDRCFGYALLTFDGVADGFNLHYLRFCREVNNGLEFLRVQNQLKSLAYRNYLSNIRDPLTGMYNSNSFARFWDDSMKRAKRYNEDIFILAVSVTGMQQINENYGTVEGDRLLMALSEILSGCCDVGEICMYFGGTSFIIIGSEGSSTQRHKLLQTRITQSLEQYNNTSDKPYRIKLHISSEIISVSKLSDAVKALDKANEMLSHSSETSGNYSEKLYFSALSSLRTEIYQHPEKKWTLELCRQHIGVSLSHFQRIYNAAFGVSCMRDVQNSKLSLAKKLLLNTSDTLDSIAAKCGYDYSHFMRIFRREFGMTPTDYRNGVTGKKTSM